MNKHLAVVFALMMMSGAPTRAAGPAEILTLDQAKKIARDNNPELLAARKKWDASRARIGVERAWEKPRATYERMYSGDEEVLGISQEIPFPGKLRARGGVAAKESDIAEWELRAKDRSVRMRVQFFYAMYYLAAKSISIFEENVDLMRRFARVTESKYAVGKVTQADVLRAQIELSKMQNMLVTLNQEKETAQAMLNTLFNLPPQSPLGMPEELVVRPIRQSLDELQRLALEKRPELLASKSALEKSGKSLIASRLEYLPDIMAEYRTRKSIRAEMDNTQDVALGVTLPLWFWNQRSMVKMASAEKEMSEAEYQSMKNMTLFEVKDLLVKLETAGRLVELYHTSVIPQAEQALKISESGYQSDKLSFLELVDVQRNLLNFRIEHFDHLAQYSQRAAELEQVIGVNLWEDLP